MPGIQIPNPDGVASQNVSKHQKCVILCQNKVSGPAAKTVFRLIFDQIFDDDPLWGVELRLDKPVGDIVTAAPCADPKLASIMLESCTNVQSCERARLDGISRKTIERNHCPVPPSPVSPDERFWSGVGDSDTGPFATKGAP